MNFLITGVAGFIGFHTANSLLDRGHKVYGLDNINDYYDTSLKNARLHILEGREGFKFFKIDISNFDLLKDVFKNDIDIVINLAAQAGVRYSIENPFAYIDSNIVGFINILECCRHNQIKHLVYASSSSVYGANTRIPFSTSHNVDHPISLYAATKKSNELMAHTYSHLYDLPTTGLRFFTVYGPWGRPDMALFKFTKSIINDEEIEVFNNGKMMRDFTYIDDIVSGIIGTSMTIPQGNKDWNSDHPLPNSSLSPWKVYNIGNSNPINLMEFVRCIEKNIGIKAKIKFLPMQPGDVPETYADVTDLIDSINYQPKVPVEIGIEKFISWYKSFYKIG